MNAATSKTVPLRSTESWSVVINVADNFMKQVHILKLMSIVYSFALKLICIFTYLRVHVNYKQIYACLSAVQYLLISL